MDAMSIKGLVKIFVDMLKLSLWQQTLTCLILLIYLLQEQNSVRNFLSTYTTDFTVMKSISVVKPKLLKFLSFCPRTLFSNGNLNESHSCPAVIFDACCERAATYCEGRARKVDIHALGYGNAGFRIKCHMIVT